MDPTLCSLKITNVEPFVHYLRIYGHLEHHEQQIEVINHHIFNMFQTNKVSIVTPQTFQTGVIAVTKSIDKLCRVQMISLSTFNKVFVKFIDFGNSKTIDMNELFLINSDDLIMNLPSQFFTFILNGIFCDWKPHQIEKISSELINKTVRVRKDFQFEEFILARVIMHNFDYTQYLLKLGNLGYAITLEKIVQTLSQLTNDTNGANPFTPPNRQIIQHQVQVQQSVNAIAVGQPSHVPPSWHPFPPDWNNQQFHQIPTSIEPIVHKDPNISSILPQPNSILPQPNSILPQPNSILPQLNSILPQPSSSILPQPNSILPQLNSILPQPSSSILPQPNSILPQPSSSILPQPNSILPQPIQNNINVVQEVPNPNVDSNQPQPKQHNINTEPTKKTEKKKKIHQISSKVEQPPQIRTVMTFKSNTLTIGSYYDVICCYVGNGPSSFSVQLTSSLNELEEMAFKLENCKLKYLQEKPSLGMACIARFSEDDQLYRAVIMDIKPTTCQVVYIDYGNTEFVSFEDIYEIPPAFLDQKIFAIRFSLSGLHELEPIDDRIKILFKDMILLKQLHLKVMPLEGPPLVQYCELYDDSNNNILKLMKNIQNKKCVYSRPETIRTGDIVVIRYVESPKKFYVQKINSIKIFEEMMDNLFLYCTKSKSSINKLEKNTACAVKFENAWYRAEIMSIRDKSILIRHVDFGNERWVPFEQLSAICGEFVKLSPQAIKCCLKGFDNTETLSESSTTQLEMLAESKYGNRRHFRCQIYEIQDNKYILNLIDETMTPELNLMKKLYNLSMPFDTYIGLEKEKKVPFYSNENQSNSQQFSVTEATVENTLPLHYDRSHQKQNRSNSNKTKKAEVIVEQHRFEKKFIQNNSKPFEQYNKSWWKQNLPPRFEKHQTENMYKKDNLKISNSERKFQNNNHERSTNNYVKKYQQSPPSAENWNSTITNTTARVQQSNFSSNNEKLSFNNSNVTSSKNKYLPLSGNTFITENLLKLPTHKIVKISWWISPHQFYIQLDVKVQLFKNMMKNLQSFYKNRPSVRSLKNNENAIAKFQINDDCIICHHSDKLFYRAKILACNENMKKYKVKLIDIGSSTIVDENSIWYVEKDFTKLPIMSYQCSFDGIMLNLNHKDILKYVEKHVQPDTTFNCEFIRYNVKNDLYYVELQSNGVSLKELLINDGAISTIEEVGMDLKLLCGQQIKAKIQTVNDLLNFEIEIEGCDLKLLCSYNDIKFIKSNPNLSVEFKNTYEGTSCVIDILDVTSDKVLMVQPLIPLFNINIPKQIICNYPIINRRFNVNIAYIETPNVIYVQPTIGQDYLDKLLDNMFEYYETNGQVVDEKTIGSLCAVKSYDENWYRARIISSENDTITVYYVDYGNTENIDNIEKNIKVLENEFREMSALAIKIYLPIKCCNTTSKDTKESISNEFSLLMDNKSHLKLNIIERYKSSWIAEILINNDINEIDQTFINILMEKSIIQGIDFGYVKNLIDSKSEQLILNDIKKEHYENSYNDGVSFNEQKTNNTSEINENCNQFQNKNDQIENNMHSAYLSHCDNPGRFFLHLKENYENLMNLQDDIQIVASSLPPLMSVVTGASCIALYSVDDTWYRAKIIDNEVMAIQFIDYGNTDVVMDSSFIKEMDKAFSNIKPFAIPCSLPIAPRETTDWVDEANQIFKDAYDKDLHFKYISKGNKINYVDLIIDGEYIAEKLIADGLARRLEIIESGEKCFISHINNLSDFYIQLEKDIDGLELVAGYLSEANNFPNLEHFVKGIICAAIFPDDGEWYRALLVEKLDDDINNIEYDVLFVDYGNRSIVKEIRKISNEIAILPHLSKKCTLWMPDHVLEWSKPAEDKFFELSGMGRTIFTIELVNPGDHAVVNLYIDEKNILEELEIICETRPSNINISDELELSFEKKTTTEDKQVAEIGAGEIEYEKNYDKIKCADAINFKDVIIIHVDAIDEFYIQKQSNEVMENKIRDISSKEILKPFINAKLNDLCVVLREGDNKYYRAKLLSKVNTNQWRTLCIDAGILLKTSQIYELPEHLKHAQPQCYRCTLYNPEGIDFKDKKLNELFEKLINPFYIKSIKLEIIEEKSDEWITRLIDGGGDIYQKLKNEFENNIIHMICEDFLTSSFEQIAETVDNICIVEEVIKVIENDKLQKVEENEVLGNDELKKVDENEVLGNNNDLEKVEENKVLGNDELEKDEENGVPGNNELQKVEENEVLGSNDELQKVEEIEVPGNNELQKVEENEVLGSNDELEKIEENEVLGSSDELEKIEENEVLGNNDELQKVEENEVLGNDESDKEEKNEVLGNDESDKEEKNEVLGNNGELEKEEENEVLGNNNELEKVEENKVLGNDELEKIEENEVLGNDESDKEQKNEVLGNNGELEKEEENEVLGNNNEIEKVEENKVLGNDVIEKDEENEVPGNNDELEKIEENEVLENDESDKEEETEVLGNNELQKVEDNEILGNNDELQKIEGNEVLGNDELEKVEENEVLGSNDELEKIEENEVLGSSDELEQIEENEVLGNNDELQKVEENEVLGNDESDKEEKNEVLGNNGELEKIEENEVLGNDESDKEENKVLRNDELEKIEENEVLGSSDELEKIEENEVLGNDESDKEQKNEVLRNNGELEKEEENEVLGNNNELEKVEENKVLGNDELEKDEENGVPGNNELQKVEENEVLGSNDELQKVEEIEVPGNNELQKVEENEVLGNGELEKVEENEVLGSSDELEKIEENEILGNNDDLEKIEEIEVLRNNDEVQKVEENGVLGNDELEKVKENRVPGNDELQNLEENEVLGNHDELEKEQVIKVLENDESEKDGENEKLKSEFEDNNMDYIFCDDFLKFLFEEISETVDNSCIVEEEINVMENNESVKEVENKVLGKIDELEKVAENMVLGNDELEEDEDNEN